MTGATARQLHDRAIEALGRKLKCFVDLSEAEDAALGELCRPVQSGPAGTELIAEGDQPHDVFLLVEGWAYRYKITADGNRQILAYLIPGDLCDVRVFILKQMDHNIGLLGRARYVAIPKEAIRQAMQQHVPIAEAMWWSTLVDEGILREWLVNLGQRSAYKRIAHLFCELFMRLRIIDLVDGYAFELPLTQQHLADTTGLTPVHVNRTLQKLREDGLIRLDRRRLELLDPKALTDAAEFDPNYLHLERRLDLHQPSA